MNSIQHEQQKPITDLRPSTPIQLEHIVNRALEKRPDARYQSAREIADDLLAYRAALTASTIVSPAPPVRRFSTATVVGVVVSAVVMLAIGLAVLVRARAESRGVRIAQQLAETERLAEAGEFAAAFALAGELERVSPANAALARLWAKSQLLRRSDRIRRVPACTAGR